MHDICGVFGLFLVGISKKNIVMKFWFMLFKLILKTVYIDSFSALKNLRDILIVKS